MIKLVGACLRTESSQRRERTDHWRHSTSASDRAGHGRLPLPASGQGCRGGGPDHERYQGEADAQQGWTRRPAAGSGLPRDMPESGPTPQLLLLSRGHLEFVVDQRVDHAPTLGLTVLGAIVCTAYPACVTFSGVVTVSAT
jgi:hypothetical protein